MRGWPVHRPTHASATSPQNKRQQRPPQNLKPKTSSCRHSVAACVSDRSLACERIPLRHRSNLQRKKQHRHSGFFRVADLGPGTMPRGKYPESPAPAGSHALISRTPPPGGMLHANLGLPRPPPRNFQPPLPQQPPKQTQQRRHNVPPVQSLRDSAAATPVGCAAWRRRFRIFSFRYREMMSGMTTGGFFHMLRPTHAPATTLKTNGNSAPHKTKKHPLMLLPPAPPIALQPATPLGDILLKFSVCLFVLSGGGGVCWNFPQKGAIIPSCPILFPRPRRAVSRTRLCSVPNGRRRGASRKFGGFCPHG